MSHSVSFSKRVRCSILALSIGAAATVLGQFPGGTASAATIYEISVTSSSSCATSAKVDDFVTDLSSITTGAGSVKDVVFSVGDTLKIVNNCPGSETIYVINSSFMNNGGASTTSVTGTNILNQSGDWFGYGQNGLFEIGNGTSLSITFNSSVVEWGYLSTLLYNANLDPVISSPVQPAANTGLQNGSSRTKNSSGDYQLSVSDPPTNCAIQGTAAQGDPQITLTGTKLNSSVYRFPKFVIGQTELSALYGEISVNQAGTSATITNNGWLNSLTPGPVTATYLTSDISTCSVTFTVSPPPSSTPVIVADVAGSALTVGDPLSIMVALSFYSPGSCTYQWMKDGQPIQNPGVDNACVSSAFDVQSAQLSDAGTYSVEITHTETGKSPSIVTSGNAVVTVVPPAPTITSVSPTSGSTTGGTAITITGTNFVGGATVNVGGAACTNVVVVSATSITCTTPTGTAGTASVVVTSGGQSNVANTLFTYVAPPSVSPSTQTVSGTAGTAVAASTAFTPNNFTGAVSYAVTNGTLPAGLAISSSTGVISGTPSAASTASVTITATGATAGSATATVTFAIVAAPATTTTTPATTTPATTTAPSGPANVTSSNQATLTQTPGAATAIVNGQPVTVAVETPADLPAAQVDPEDRSPAQVQSLQVAADNLVDQLNQAAGGNSGLAVQDTPTGAAITGLLDKPVPVENTVLIEAANKSTLFAALNQDGSVTEVQPGAVIEVLGNGQVGVVASGLTPGESVEFVIMSTPTLLGTYTVASNGTIKAQTSLPNGIGLGDHTLVVASPTVQASLGLKVSATPSTLPATGASSNNMMQIALWLLVGGLMVAFLRRRRHILN
jgi:LPXTG-motif cell wall-anchored protein